MFIHLGNLPSENDDPEPDHDTTADDNGQPKAPVKKKRARKQVSTVTTNKSTLNSRLELIQMPDSLYFQLNLIMGETSSSSKLLLNLLQTKNSDLKMMMTEKFWDSSIYEPIVFKPQPFADDTEFTELNVKLKVDPRLTLRQQMKGYLISNTPMDDEDEE